MTHDEVMAWIDEHLENLAIILADPRPEELSIWDYFNASLLALRAVVELHKPHARINPEKVLCADCTTRSTYDVFYPCPTIQAIEKELE